MTSEAVQNQRPKAQKLRPNVARLIAVIFLSTALLVVGLFVGRIGIQGWAIYQSGKHIEETLQRDPTLASLPMLREELAQIADAVAAIERQVSPMMPALEMLRGLSVYGDTAAAGPALLAAGSSLLSLASDAVTILTPALIEMGDSPNLEDFATVLADSGADLADLAPRAEEANIILATVVADELHPAFTAPLSNIQKATPLLAPGLRLAPYMSLLLGFDEPTNYMVLVQNNYELRATGGFISAVGLLTIENGRIADLDFLDSYDIFRDDSQYPAAPQPMQQYMDIPIMLFRDTNWSPDLPTSAQLARALFLQDTGKEFDGIVTIDLHAVEALTAALGPLQIEGVDEPIGSDNIVEAITQLWTQPVGAEASASAKPSGHWWPQRKDFMPALAGAALSQIQAGNVDYANLALAGLSSLDRRSIQIWSAEPGAASAFADLGWDGGMMATGDADFLALIDTNMGYNKVNAVVEAAMHHGVTWPDGANGSGVATTTITYRHPVEQPDHICDPTPRYGDSYEEMMVRCYFNYVRLYVSPGSRLVDVEGFEPDSATSMRGEKGAQVFTGWFVLPPGQEQTVSFTYELPTTITKDEYRLAVLRQSGSGPLPLRVRVGDEALDTVVERGRFEWQPN